MKKFGWSGLPGGAPRFLRTTRRFFIHLLRDIPHVPALLGEKVCLVLPILDIFFQSGVFHPFAFQPGFDILHHFEIVAGILLHLLRENIQIKHAVGEGIQKSASCEMTMQVFLYSIETP